MAHAEVELPVSRLNDVLAHFGGAAPRNKEDLCFALTAEEVSFRSSAVLRGARQAADRHGLAMFRVRSDETHRNALRLV